MVRRFMLILVAVGMAAVAFAQTASVQGKIMDESTGEMLLGVTVSLKKGETVIAATSSDMEGNYNFSNVQPGNYDMLFEYMGYSPYMLQKVMFPVGGTLRQDVKMPVSVDIEILVVVEYKIPLITPNNIISGEDIKHQPGRDFNDIANADARINQKDAGEEVKVMSDRGSGTDIYIDGVLSTNGETGLSETEIEQVQISTTGIPAEFGDATAGIINIITKGPSDYFMGGVQVETSQFLDAFGSNRIDMNFSGPLISRPVYIANSRDTLKKDGKAVRQTILGYRLSGTFYTDLDSRPSALPSYKIKEETLDQLNANPLVRDENGGLVLASNYLTQDDLEFTRVRPNARQSTGLFNGKIELRPSQDLFFVLGGQLQYDFGKLPSTMNRLMNYENNNEYKSSMYRINGRFRHTVSATTPKMEQGDSTYIQPVFQNLSYELQADYTRNDYQQYDPRYQDRLFEYGYVGKIYRHLAPVLGVVDSNYIVNSNGDTLGVNPVLGHAANQIVFDGFEADYGINPVLAAYNNLLDMSQVTSMEQLEIVNGRFTGNRLSAFGLFNSPGQTGNATQEGSSYGKSNSTQFRANLRTNFDLVMNPKASNPVRHSIQMGGVYEQRIARSYNINPFSLWTLADQSANSHLSFATDAERPDGGSFLDPLTQHYYNTNSPLIREDENGNLVEMTQFGERVRSALNKDQYDWVNVHELTPDQLSLDMFDASSLIQGRQRVLDYYGYDYLGNPLGANTQFNDFFTATDSETGRKTRPVAPFKPIYVAGYIQDKFTFKDMNFNVGVRFDSYDANTKVLRDPYSLAGYYQAGEFKSGNTPYAAASDLVLPANIGDDFAVYVNSNSPEASVVGFRDGDQWYDKTGLPINNPAELGSTVMPALRGFSTSENDPQGENYNPDLAFRDYKPTLIVMPRLAFTFPISKEAQFYANYDVLAQRPPDGNFASALTYFNFRETVAGGGFIGNPNLKSQRSINYEVGFQQAINACSKIKVSMVYREERNLIQIQQYVLAYPVTYTTFGNSDFSTFKSFVLEYELRPHPVVNKNLRIVANYALQFADGTGSSPTSAANTAVQELKYVFPLDYDQRHSFYLNVDYRFGAGEMYNGPRIKTKKGNALDILANTGLNVLFNLNSGSPYTRKTIPGGIGTSFADRNTEGSINGARMPWNFRMDLRLDRNFVIGKNSKHPLLLNVYLRMQNVFNTQNVLNVYSATGSPTEDGFLTMQNSQGQSLMANYPASYQTLYDLRMRDPFNISRPRRIFLGLKFSF